MLSFPSRRVYPALCRMCRCAWSVAVSCTGLRSGMPAVVAREAWREGGRVLAPWHPVVGGVGKDCCPLGRRVVALGLLGQSWRTRWELRTKRFSGTPWEVCRHPMRWRHCCQKYIGNLCFGRSLHHSFLHAGVGGGSSSRSRPHQACRDRVQLGRKSRKSWRCNGPKSS